MSHAAAEKKLSWEEAEELRKQAEFKKLFESVDWAKQEDMLKVWPVHVRESLALARQKNVSRAVDIYPFTLKSITGGILLQDTQLLLEPGKKICLIGDNGTGKTTLFSTLASGAVKDFPKHLSVLHCKELEHKENELSVIETVVKSHDFRNILLDCEVQLKKNIEEADAANPKPEDAVAAKWEPTDRQKALRANLEFVNRQLSLIQSATAYTRAAQMLRVLGFDDAAQQRSLSSLSGGLRMRVALCAAFFIEPDLLLLDDPTNHLDFPSVLWLENRMRGYRKSFVLVSHDRELLEGVCNQVVYIENKELIYYNMGFPEFEKTKAKADKKKADDIEKFLLANRSSDPSSALGRERKDKQEWLANYKQKMIMQAGKFVFPAPKMLTADGNDESNDRKIDLEDPNAVAAEQVEVSLIKVDNVRFSYSVEKGLPYIFDDPISIDVTTKSRIGVMGPNGAGKSTFLKLITDKLKPNSGTITRHPTAQVAYFAQHHVMELNLQQTPMEFMIREFPEIENTGILRNHLAKVGVVGNKADTRLIDMSGGQRSCVMFAKLTFTPPHLLIMDEPTNFLDLVSVDSLIAATNKYKGALLLVSHNRYFLNKCAKQYLSIVPGQFLLFNDLAKCEKATYTFIADLEAGNDVKTSELIKRPSDAASVNLAKQNGTLGQPEKKSVSASGIKIVAMKKPAAAAPAASAPASAPAPAAAKPAAAPAASAPKPAAPAAKPAAPAPQSRPGSAAPKKPCAFFQAGNCKNGANCQFAHTGAPGKK